MRALGTAQVGNRGSDLWPGVLRYKVAAGPSVPPPSLHPFLPRSLSLLSISLHSSLVTVAQHEITCRSMPD